MVPLQYTGGIKNNRGYIRDLHRSMTIKGTKQRCLLIRQSEIVHFNCGRRSESYLLCPKNSKCGVVGQLGRVNGLKIRTVWVRVPPTLPLRT